MRWFEPHWLELTKKELKIRNLDRPLRLLHLSDFHVTSEEDLEALEKAIHLGLKERPDLAVITGDFFTTLWGDIQAYADRLRILSDAIPTIACPGNHDGGAWADRFHGYRDLSQLQKLSDLANVNLLENAVMELSIKDRRLKIVGLGDLWARDLQPETALEVLPGESDIPTIVLSHNPDSKELLQSYHWDLLCCGHTHGGQCTVPLLGWRPFLPVNDRSFPEGVLSWRGRHIHITRGVGNLHGMRFNCRPEVSILDLS